MIRMQGCYLLAYLPLQGCWVRHSLPRHRVAPALASARLVPNGYCAIANEPSSAGFQFTWHHFASGEGEADVARCLRTLLRDRGSSLPVDMMTSSGSYGAYPGVSPSFTIRCLRQEPWKYRCITRTTADGKLTNCDPPGEAIPSMRLPTTRAAPRHPRSWSGECRRR
jgi:hypothetical protein